MSSFLEFLSRPGCHLCDDVRPAITRVASLTGTDLCEINVDLDPETAVDFGLRIPVVRWNDGTVIAEGQIDVRALLPSVLFGRMRRMGRPDSPSK